MSSTKPSLPGTRKPVHLESEDIFRTLVGSITDYAIFVLDPQGYVATWNPGAKRFKGYEAHEIIGKHFSVFYPQSDIDSGKPAMELEVAAAVGRFEDEGWRIRKDGTRFWANVIITRLLDKNGNLLGFGKVTRDLTERRLAEQRYRLLVESVQDYAIYSLDANGIVTSWNTGAQRIKGYPAEEIVGKHFSNFYTPEDRAAGMPQYVLHTAATQGHFEGEGWRMRKDGTRFWSSVVVTPLYDEDGKLSGFSKVTRDITDRKKLLDQVSAHAAELELRIAEREATNAELEAFSYSVSHDLRAPLRAIEGFANALFEDYGDKLGQEGSDFLTEIQNAAKRMSKLVQDLLNYSRLGRVELAFAPVNVLELVRKTCTELGPDCRYIRCDIDPGLAVIAHAPTLGQALTNLINNALKFRRPDVDPEVRVTARPWHNNTISISVTDNGIGIAPEHIERIFKVFERLHNRDSYPGTGIGLAIVRRAITRMGGTVNVDSQLGEGSTFWIELPAAKEVVVGSSNDIAR